MATQKNTNRHSCARKTAYTQPRSNRQKLATVALEEDGAAKPQPVSSEGGDATASLGVLTNEPSDSSNPAITLWIRVETDQYRRQNPFWGDIHKGDTLVIQKGLCAVDGDVVLVIDNASQSYILLGVKVLASGDCSYLHWTGAVVGNASFSDVGTVVEIRRPTEAARRQRLRNLYSASTTAKLSDETVRAVLRQVSEWPTTLEENEDDLSADVLWSMRNTQVNTDITCALECEDAGDITEDDMEDGFMLFPDSPAYQNLRQRFIEDATKPGACYAFQFAIWRAYNAGRLSPTRLKPHTQKQREERRRAAAGNR